MIPLSSAASSGLTWSKIPHTRDYELKLNDEVVGTLSRANRCSSNFLGETWQGRWLFRRSGVLSTGSEIVDAASQERIATFKSAWTGGGVLNFADGQHFRLECKGWWRPVWSAIAADGSPVLHLRAREKTVNLPTPAPVAESRLSLLIMFLWYRMLQNEEDAASVAVIAAS